MGRAISESALCLLSVLSHGSVYKCTGERYVLLGGVTE